MTLDINKATWRKVKLGEVVEWYQKDIKNEDQEVEGIENYLTATHIDGDAVRIGRYNKIEDGQKGPTITKHFEKGDLLLSTRSVALRKAAIAPVSGVTGEKLLVLRVKPDSDLIPELLPFIFQSTDFWGFAQNSASGSVNKFTSWTKVKNYQFLLPPKAEQARLAELLWAGDAVLEGLETSKEKQTDLSQSLNKELFSGEYFNEPITKHNKLGIIPKSWVIKLLDDICEEPICYGIVQPGEHQVDGVPVVQIKNIVQFSDNLMHCVAPGIESKYVRSRIKHGDLILAIKGTIGVCNEVPESFEGNIGRDTAKLNIQDDLLRSYVKWLFRSTKYQQYFDRVKVGSTRFELSIGTLRKLKIIVPPEDRMIRIVRVFENQQDSVLHINSSLSTTKSLQKSLINQIF